MEEIMSREVWLFLVILFLAGSAYLEFGCTTVPVATSSQTATSTATSTATQTAVQAQPVSGQIAVADGVSMPLTGWQPAYEKIVRQVYPTTNLANVDASDYCPNYAKLSDKAAFWVALIHWDSYYESSWKRTDQYVENGIPGSDPITGSQTISSGLEQISYGDQVNYPYSYCKMMNYAADKKLALAAQSINNPVINLGCTMQIFSYRATKYPGPLHGLRSLGAYWSSLRSIADHKNGKFEVIVPKIKTEVPGC
jgi:hypothetical protein